jgi:ubiquinone/menaquinone biosynthesis C-methylase UbiE
MPTGTAAILNSRTLTTAHRRLAQLLQPDLCVLDIGCGTGAITRGIAEAVTPHGYAIGVDVHHGLIVQAHQAHHAVPGLAFVVTDIYALPFQATFDIVTAARVLQWLDDPLAALRMMARVTRPGGRVLVLDYQHERIVWEPAPPASMQTFYGAFLCWRAEAGMDNALADHLPTLYTQAGLEAIVVTPQHEVSRRGDPDFATRLGIWAEVAATRGHQMVADGVTTEAQRAAAEVEYRAWIQDQALAQTMHMVAVEGLRPHE